MVAAFSFYLNFTKSEIYKKYAFFAKKIFLSSFVDRRISARFEFCLKVLYVIFKIST